MIFKKQKNIEEIVDELEEKAIKCTRSSGSMFAESISYIEYKPRLFIKAAKKCEKAGLIERSKQDYSSAAAIFIVGGNIKKAERLVKEKKLEDYVVLIAKLALNYYARQARCNPYEHGYRIQEHQSGILEDLKEAKLINSEQSREVHKWFYNPRL